MENMMTVPKRRFWLTYKLKITVNRSKSAASIQSPLKLKSNTSFLVNFAALNFCDFRV